MQGGEDTSTGSGPHTTLSSILNHTLTSTPYTQHTLDYTSPPLTTLTTLNTNESTLTTLGTNESTLTPLLTPTLTSNDTYTRNTTGWTHDMVITDLFTKYDKLIIGTSIKVILLLALMIALCVRKQNPRRKNPRIEPYQLDKSKRLTPDNHDTPYPRLYRLRQIRPTDETAKTDSRHTSQTARHVTLTPSGSIKIITNLETECQDVSDQFVHSFNNKDN